MTLLVENANNCYTQAIYSHDGDPELGQGEAGRSLLHPVLAAERQELRHHRHLLTVIITSIVKLVGKGLTQEGHSKVIYRLKMVDGGYPFPRAYIKVSCHPPTHHHHPPDV